MKESTTPAPEALEALCGLLAAQDATRDYMRSIPYGYLPDQNHLGRLLKAEEKAEATARAALSAPTVPASGKVMEGPEPSVLEKVYAWHCAQVKRCISDGLPTELAVAIEKSIDPKHEQIAHKVIRGATPLPETKEGCKKCGERFIDAETHTCVPALVQDRGLYRKYDVRRSDGSSAPGRKHEHCQYYVLDLSHDRHAFAALVAYSRSCASDFPLLSRDLQATAFSMMQQFDGLEWPATAPVVEPEEPLDLEAEEKAFRAWWPSVGQTIGEAAAWQAWKGRAIRASQGKAQGGQS